MRTERVKASGLRRHFEGWQAGLVALSIAAVGLVLGAPHAVVPRELPAPVPDEAALARGFEAERARARGLEAMPERERSKGHGFDLRVLGEWIRRYGEADVARDRDRLAAVRQELLRVARAVQDEAGDEPLLALRAYQMGVFLRGLSDWEASGKESPEAALVGGDFLGLAEQNRWTSPPHRLLPSVSVRAALFKRRFAEMLALKSPAFALGLDETRALYAFFFLRPPGGPLPEQGDDAGAARPRWEWLARKVEELGAVDRDYPVELARGVALFHLGEPRGAAIAFRDHLVKHPDGPYTLRARNHLAAAVALAGPAL